MLDIYVINLSERTDRWEQIITELGTDFNLIRVNAVKHEIGTIGCFMSHQKCIQIAKDNGLSSIIVAEDDCIKNPIKKSNFVERLHNMKEFLNNYKNWDIFLGGCTKTTTKDIITKVDCETDNIIQISKAATTHFMIYNSSCYDFYLDIDEDKYGYHVDRIWWGKKIALTSLPFLAYQQEGHSDIINGNVDYNGKIKRTENRLFQYLNN